VFRVLRPHSITLHCKRENSYKKLRTESKLECWSNFQTHKVRVAIKSLFVVCGVFCFCWAAEEFSATKMFTYVWSFRQPLTIFVHFFLWCRNCCHETEASFLFLLISFPINLALIDWTERTTDLMKKDHWKNWIRFFKQLAFECLPQNRSSIRRK
jgi:hypothetical protein